MEQKSFMMYTEWIKKGVGSFDDVVDGWNILQKYGVDTNILCTIHNANAKYPLDIYRFFRDELGANHIQFIPIIERATPETILQADKGWGSSKASNRPLYLQQGSLVTNRSVKPLEFGNFLCDIFDEWVKNDVGTVFVNTFDVALDGWSTFWIGKNHNVAEQDVASGASRKQWPLAMGFDRFYGFLGGETNQWYPDLVEDNRFTEQPYLPEEGYHLSKDLADKAITMIQDQKATNPSKPWYMWFCPGANHAPHHCPQVFACYYGQIHEM